MKIVYVVEMLRYGERESHSYIAGVYSDRKMAEYEAKLHMIMRAGKYSAEIHQEEVDGHGGRGENMLRKIKYWYWRKYKEYPHAHEMLELYARGMPKTGDDKNKYIWAERTLDYLWTMDIAETAENYNVTRERVRQCVWKAYRKWSVIK